MPNKYKLPNQFSTYIGNLIIDAYDLKSASRVFGLHVSVLSRFRASLVDRANCASDLSIGVSGI
jgi:hypothetical protein